MATRPVAIIDVGSNSIRLVVYSGERRVPMAMFNEKILAGLATGLSETGAISDSAAELALQALRRFKRIVEHIGAGRTQLVATAAIRDATNGPAFVREIKALGLPCRVLQPEEEAELAGLGVLSAIPWADGIAGDLGGGSLELVDISGGKTSRPVSLPLGVLRLKPDRKAIRKAIRKGIAKAGFECGGKRDFYMVGGSWRALARIDMIDGGYPLPILHNYRMPAARVGELSKLVDKPDPAWTASITPARLESSPVAAMLLSALAKELQPRRMIVSTYGIREGLLYSQLRAKDRRLDPLVCAARDLSKAEGHGESLGDSLDQWMAGAFDDVPAKARLRLTACLLADIAWRANPQFRAERAIETALHDNWVGVDAAGRILIAHALAWALANDDLADIKLLQLCKTDDVLRARAWGLAIQAGLRLSGGVASVLDETSLTLSDGMIELRVPADEEDLVNDGVVKRLDRLALAMDAGAAIVAG